MAQLSDQADRALDDYSKAIGELKVALEHSQRNYDQLWDEVIEIFKEFDVKKFLASDGYKLSLQEREREPKLDEAKLEQMLEEHIFWSICKPRVDPALLEQAVADGRISHEVLEACLTPQPPVVARVRGAWSKEDKVLARIIGVEPENGSR